MYVTRTFVFSGVRISRVLARRSIASVGSGHSLSMLQSDLRESVSSAAIHLSMCASTNECHTFGEGCCPATSNARCETAARNDDDIVCSPVPIVSSSCCGCSCAQSRRVRRRGSVCRSRRHTRRRGVADGETRFIIGIIFNVVIGDR